MGQFCATEDSTATRPQTDLDSPSTTEVEHASTEVEHASSSPPMLSDVPALEREADSATPVPFTPVKKRHVTSIIQPTDANANDVEEFEGPITPARPAPPQLVEGWLVDTQRFTACIDLKGEYELLGSASADILEPSENGFISELRGPSTPIRKVAPPTLLNFFAAALAQGIGSNVTRPLQR